METKVCIQCGEEKELKSFDLSFNSGKHKHRCKACYAARYRTKFFLEFLAAYGNKCNCCGEDDFRFLSLDHIGNDGRNQKRELGYNEQQIYQLAKREGYPKDKYQILCHNCNHGKFINKGICPHKDISKEEYLEKLQLKVLVVGKKYSNVNKTGLTLGPQKLRQDALERNKGYESRREMLRAEKRDNKKKDKMTELLKVLLNSGLKPEDILSNLQNG